MQVLAALLLVVCLGLPLLLTALEYRREKKTK